MKIFKIFGIFFFDSKSIPGVPGPILGGPGPSKPALGLKTRFIDFVKNQIFYKNWAAASAEGLLNIVQWP